MSAGPLRPGCMQAFVKAAHNIVDDWDPFTDEEIDFGISLFRLELDENREETPAFAVPKPDATPASTEPAPPHSPTSSTISTATTVSSAVFVTTPTPSVAAPAAQGNRGVPLFKVPTKAKTGAPVLTKSGFPKGSVPVPSAGVAPLAGPPTTGSGNYAYLTSLPLPQQPQQSIGITYSSPVPKGNAPVPPPPPPSAVPVIPVEQDESFYAIWYPEHLAGPWLGYWDWIVHSDRRAVGKKKLSEQACRDYLARRGKPGADRALRRAR